MTRALSAPAGGHAIARPARTRGLRAALKAWWAAYQRSRRERQTAEQLHSMSDRQLKDIGLVRTQIDFVVRRGPECRPESMRSWSEEAVR